MKFIMFPILATDVPATPNRPVYGEGVIGGVPTENTNPNPFIEMDSIISTLESVIDFSVGILEYIIENPILLFILAVSFVPVGLKVLQIMKRSVK